MVCDSMRFANLRDVVRYEYVANHKWKMWRIGEENPVIYDTTSGEFE